MGKHHKGKEPTEAETALPSGSPGLVYCGQLVWGAGASVYYIGNQGGWGRIFSVRFRREHWWKSQHSWQDPGNADSRGE